MGRVRRCDTRCHTAKRPRCRCRCGGGFHGSAGAANRDGLMQAVDEALILKEHGFKNGETVYIDQLKLPVGVA